MIDGSEKISPDWLPKIAEKIEAENTGKFPKPAKWNRKGCEESTEGFARYRLHYFAAMADEIDPERKLFNPILDYFVKEYPLPLGLVAINECYSRNSWDDGPREIIPSPFVERLDAYAGLAIRFESDRAIGWFLGLVQPYNLYTMPEKDRDLLPEGAWFYWAYHMEFVFIKGMILIEGSLDEKVIGDLRAYEKYYNKHVLGKVITGRPRVDPEYLLEPARKIIAADPEIRQDDLAYKLHCDLKTFKINRQKAGFATFQAFKDSILKP